MLKPDLAVYNQLGRAQGPLWVEERGDYNIEAE